MSMKDIDIQGKASISRDVNIGGQAAVNGNVTVGHNLIVKGWVDAPNIKGPLKGLYASEEALKAAYPRPMPGWYALVGNTLPADVWRVDRGAWTPTGETGGQFNLWLDRLEMDVNDIKSETETVKKALEKEISDRTTSDTALGTRIENEAATRSAADSTLGTRINEEASTRSGADSALDKRLVPVEGKTAAMMLCDGILGPTDKTTKTGTYLQRDPDGDLIQIVRITSEETVRSMPEEGKLYVCGGVVYLSNGIILEAAGHRDFVFDGGDAFTQHPYPTAIIGGGTPETDYTVAKIYDGGGARL